MGVAVAREEVVLVLPSRGLAAPRGEGGVGCWGKGGTYITHA